MEKLPSADQRRRNLNPQMIKEFILTSKERIIGAEVKRNSKFTVIDFPYFIMEPMDEDGQFIDPRLAPPKLMPYFAMNFDARMEISNTSILTSTHVQERFVWTFVETVYNLPPMDVPRYKRPFMFDVSDEGLKNIQSRMNECLDIETIKSLFNNVEFVEFEKRDV